MPGMAEPWTREMVLALPDDGNRYELFGDELLVTPAPTWRHQHVVLAFAEQLMPWLRSTGVGYVLLAPADLALDGRQLAQPDLFVVPGRGAAPPAAWSEAHLPVLVLEVVSPGSARYDRQVKRRWFQRAGIQEYWIVDPDARQVERWRPEDSRPEVLEVHLEWRPTGAATPLVIDLVTLFSDALGPIE